MPGKFSEYRCNNCGLVKLDSQPSNLKKYYPTKNYYSYAAKSRKSFLGWLRSFLILHRLFGFVPAMPGQKTGRILDIGCGSGDTLLLLKSVGWDIYGLDIDPGAIRIARKRGLKNISLGTYESVAKYPDNFFDAIRLYHVIEHLDDPNNCLRLAYKKLKPGGELIIGTPNVHSLVARIFKQYWYNLDCPRHLYLFTPKTLGALASKNKLDGHETTFASAGGWVGSIQYVLEQLTRKDIDLINRQWLVIACYPLEWVLDRLRLGDVFVLTASK